MSFVFHKSQTWPWRWRLKVFISGYVRSGWDFAENQLQWNIYVSSAYFHSCRLQLPKINVPLTFFIEQYFTVRIRSRNKMFSWILKYLTAIATDVKYMVTGIFVIFIIITTVVKRMGFEVKRTEWWTSDDVFMRHYWVMNLK